MDKIIITNIGNRNLKLNGDFLINNFRKNSESFRTITHSILEKIKSNEFNEDLQPVIINEVIEKEKDDLKKVIFFSSNMPPNIRNDQDTIYEGEILCYLLKKEYPSIEFINKPVEAKVFSHDEIFRHYRGHLSDLKEKNPDSLLIYCDAGGTSQQKFAMKIALEFLYPRDQLKIYYVAQGEKGKSKVMKGESYEYRKIIDIENVLQAIKLSSYKYAIQLLNNLEIKKTSRFPYNTIIFLDYRSRILIEDAKNLGKNISQNKMAPSWIDNYSKGIPLGSFDLWKDVFSQKQFFNLCEILISFQWKYTLGLYEQAVLRFSNFIENYLAYSIKKKFGYKFDKHFNSAHRQLGKDIKKGKIKLSDNIDIENGGVPLLISVAELIDNKHHKKVIENIKQVNSFFINNNKKGLDTNKKRGLDSFRNMYAHRGKGIRKEDFEKTCSKDILEECFKDFGMDYNINYYREMQNYVCELIKESTW